MPPAEIAFDSATCAKGMFTITAGPGLPASVGTLQEFVQWYKANPTQALFGSTSMGGAPTMNDLLAGVIPASTNTVSEVLPHLKSGRVRVLAVSGSTRSSFTPEVPTVIESGYEDVVAEAWPWWAPSSRAGGRWSRPPAS